MSTLKSGARVAFARSFLRSIGTFPSDPLWFQRGTVFKVGAQVHLNGPHLITVQWDHGGTSRSLESNLCAVERLQFEER